MIAIRMSLELSGLHLFSSEKIVFLYFSPNQYFPSQSLILHFYYVRLMVVFLIIFFRMSIVIHSYSQCFLRIPVFTSDYGPRANRVKFDATLKIALVSRLFNIWCRLVNFLEFLFLPNLTKLWTNSEPSLVIAIFQDLKDYIP